MVPDAAFFLPSMLDDEPFAGVVADDSLVAIACTHVLRQQYDVARSTTGASSS
ncbi:MAG: hypothetical protein ACKVIQ_07490 [Acidimicrobiales bacterium]